MAACCFIGFNEMAKGIGQKSILSKYLTSACLKIKVQMGTMIEKYWVCLCFVLFIWLHQRLYFAM